MKDNGLHIDKYGNFHYFKNGLYHREEGPAFIGSNGSKWWCINGKLHREDGPAFIHCNGLEEWFINGIKIEYNKIISI